MTQDTLKEHRILDIENRFAKASVSLYGGQVLRFQPDNTEEVLWLSPEAIYESGKAIRGGIPVCWPWFGQREEGGPNHGFARTRLWSLDHHETMSTGETRLILSLPDCRHPEWEGKASLKSEIIIGKTLRVSLTTQNLGEERLSISQALHSYFTVGHVENIRIEGLDQTQYFDETDHHKLCVQYGDVTLQGEVDRTYLDESQQTTLHDLQLGREVTVAKTGSNATVVWNPGKSLAEQMSDMSVAHFHTMACLETVTSPDFPVMIEAGESHTISVEISVS